MNRWASQAVAVYLHDLSSTEAAAWAAQEVADALGFPAPAEERRTDLGCHGRSIMYSERAVPGRPAVQVSAFLAGDAPEWEPVVL